MEDDQLALTALIESATTVAVSAGTERDLKTSANAFLKHCYDTYPLAERESPKEGDTPGGENGG